MRLIDADTLNFTCTADEDYKCQKIVDCNCCPFHAITSFEIENEPIIQAVPIEVLDKIRAEILNLKEKCNASDYLGCGILEIIDKYRGNERNTARWAVVHDEQGEIIVCGNCGRVFPTMEPYCGNCGRRMLKPVKEGEA